MSPGKCAGGWISEYILGRIANKILKYKRGRITDRRRNRTSNRIYIKYIFDILLW